MHQGCAASSGCGSVISIGKVRSADYYLAEVGRDDASGCYVDTERAGRWHGRLAADFGLSGRVDAGDFRAVLEGYHPERLERLTAHPTRVKALDVTLSVPKSVSIAWALGEHTTSRQVERALDESPPPRPLPNFLSRPPDGSGPSKASLRRCANVFQSCRHQSGPRSSSTPRRRTEPSASSWPTIEMPGTRRPAVMTWR